MFLNKIFDTPILQCELCKNITPKHSAYICESGHTICINCDDDLDDTEESFEKGEVDRQNNTTNDLAGGDYVQQPTKTDNSKNVKRKSSKTKHEGIDITKLKKSFRHTSNTPETTIVYKNLGFDNTESVKSLINSPDTNKDIEKINIRPIICPVSQCKKTVAFNSILKHFTFDHSEILTLPINIRKTLKIYLKPINLSIDTKCVAIIKPIGSKATLMLMAAKIAHSNYTTNKDIQASDNNLKSNVSLQDQTDADHGKNLQHVKDMQEDIIIWFCRLTEYKQVCCVKVKRENILGYSYMGEGLDIQSQVHDPISVYNSPECLLLRFYSIPKLLDDQEQIHVYINILK